MPLPLVIDDDDDDELYFCAMPGACALLIGEILASLE